MPEAVTTKLNDVDLASVASLINKVQEKPDVADSKRQADVAWNGGFRSEAMVCDFSSTKSDEPEQLGGTNTGPNPVEQVLGALGNCLAVGYAANATAMGIEIKELSIKVEGDLDLHTFLGLAAGNAGFSNIDVKVDLKSDASAEDLRNLHDKVTNTSPVGHTLSRAVPLNVELV